MSEDRKPDLEERVARLEKMVEALLRERPDRGPESTGRPRPTGPERKPSTIRPPGTGEKVPGTGTPWRGAGRKDDLSLAGQGERWLGRIGAGFVVLALAFLLKLSFDRGWITPELRLGAGFGTGLAMLAFGLRLDPARRRLEQALLGGAVAIFYLTVFAGFQLYALLPFWPALSLMTTTTVLSIALSERQDSPLLSMMGVTGGFATPFLLNTGSGNVNALAVYVFLVLLGGGVVQFHRRWVPLLATLLLGGVVVLSLMASGAGEGARLLPALTVVAFWLVCGASPILQAVVGAGSRWTGTPRLDLALARGALASSTALTVALLVVILDLEKEGAAGLLFLYGGLTGAFAFWARKVKLAQWPCAEVSALAVALGWLFLVGESTAWLLILAEATVLFVLVSLRAPKSLATLGHVLAAGAAMGFVYFAGHAPLGGFLGLREEGLARLGIVALFALISLRIDEDAAPWYRGAAYVGLLVWFLSELGPKEYGTQWVSVAWSLQGATALVWSLKNGSHPLQLTGLATLGLVAAKLLLVDLAQLDPGWRILMFFGFGVGLLGLAYLVNRPRTATKGEQRGP